MEGYRCGRMTTRGKPCKNPYGSCRFHSKKTSPKKSPEMQWESPPKSTLKSSSIPKSDSPKKRGKVWSVKAPGLSPEASPLSPPRIEKGSNIDLLNNLPQPVLYQTLLKIPRDELNEICKSASKMRRKGILTNIEKMCRNKGFQEDYALKHPFKYPEILKRGEYTVFGIENISTIKVKVGFTRYEDSRYLFLSYTDGYGIRIERINVRDDYYTTPLKPFAVGWDSPISDEQAKKIAIERTGRPDLFSADVEKRGEAVVSLIKQIISEIKRKYPGEGDEFLSSLKEYSEKFIFVWNY